MRKVFLLFCAGLASLFSHSQLLTWTPDFAKDNDNITITVDATKGNQGLMGFSGNVYVHIGVITNLSTSSSNWLHVPFTWGTTPSAAQATPAGTNKWSYTINNIRSFFGATTGETILKIAILFRDGPGNTVQRNSDGSDMFVPVYSNGLHIRFSQPPFQPTYTTIPEPIAKQVGDNITLTAISDQAATLRIWLNNSLIQSASNATTVTAAPALTTSGQQEVIVDAQNVNGGTTDTLRFFVSPSVNVAPLPAGVRDGINYAANNTDVTLVLFAPGKSRVSVIGEFAGSNWAEQSQYIMNKTPDGNYWWLTITGLTPGTEYAFQYLVDGTLKVGEPYCEKILDPANDGSISSSTYPGLKPYPAGLTTGVVSVLQTNAPAYNWAVNSFSRPDKRNLFIYELLVRDFVAAHDWKTIRDTLSYLKTLGVNAIEVMPFNEFEGNDSWGYNPDFFLAPDKYYGSKNSLKEFVDSCHKRGIAVIMDIALNHTTGLNPLAALYWNSATNQPAANNPWLNVTATHPYSVFNDFNHESLNTRYFTSRVIEYWLQEYKLDGFRWDLAKGFTQNVQCGASTTNESCISDYHADRVAIWKRYYDSMQLKSPGSYCILELFAANTEETELSNYGMMPWGNMSYNFEQAAMGYATGWDFSGGLYSVRGWTNPYLVTYMESHDEERLAYKNINFGNSSASYNTKDSSINIGRIEMCTAFFMSMPGPKMIWQFGELGYDYPINYCVDGTINNNCRLDKKPIRWDYKQATRRQGLYNIYSSLSKLRYHGWYKDIFIANNVTIDRDLSGAFKWMKLRSATDSSELVVVGNFDVAAQTSSVTFPTAGTWYDYLNGNTFTATGASQSITLQPGEYHIYLNRNLTNAVTTPVIDINNPGNALQLFVYPNPVGNNSIAEIYIPERSNIQMDLWNVQGQKTANILAGTLAKGKHTVTLSDKTNNLPAGIYLLKVYAKNKMQSVKILIQ